MNSLKRILFLAVFIIGSCIPVLAAPDGWTALPQRFKDVKDSVVVIYTEEREVSKGEKNLRSSEYHGSGVLISKTGQIMTAAHIVQAADSLEVKFSNGETVEAETIVSDRPADLALIQLKSVPKNVKVATMGDSEGVEVGDPVFVVGSPKKMDYTLTAGFVSAKRAPNTRFSGMMPVDLIQTDAAINSGNSGGPMFDLDGNVIGIVSYSITKTGSDDGLGFAVSINAAKRILLDEPLFWSGIEGSPISGDMAKIFNLPQDSGYIISYVAHNSPAEKMDLRGGSYKAVIDDEDYILGGDIILKVNGIAAGGAESYQKIRADLLAMKETDELILTILREGKTIEITSSRP